MSRALRALASQTPRRCQVALAADGRPGSLDGCPVDAVREVTELITAQRGYEMNAKVITAADQMLAATTQVR